jgi:His-Xaa-Ser system protein HxsD
MEDIIQILNKNKLLIKLNQNIYNKEVIFATSNYFSLKCIILIDSIDGNYIDVIFEQKQGININLKIVAEEFCNEIIKKQLQYEINERTKKIRELIVEHAFSPIKNLNEEMRYYE